MVEKLAELGIASPWLNVPGFLGYLPLAQLDFSALLGAFSPPPLSLVARSPVANRTALPFAGGVLLHTGLPNPGFASALRQYGQRWSRLAVPLWLNGMPADAAEAQEFSERVDELEYVAVYQITLPEGIPLLAKAEILKASRGEKPFFVEIPLGEMNSETLAVAEKSGAFGVVIGAPRGSLPLEKARVSGRLYGPALYPQVVRAVEQFSACGLAVVAGCGVTSIEQGADLLKLGAAAVQFDVTLWA